jgi:hypothetical protein
MDASSPTWQFISAELALVLGVFVARYAAMAFKTTFRRSLLLYVWHTLFCVVAVQYLISYGGDAIDYYQHAIAGNIEFSAGTAAVGFITILFASVLKLSFFTTSLVFQIPGFIGLLAFDASLRAAIAGKHRYVRALAMLIAFLPSMSFWSASIGKDSLSFMATGFALWAALDLRRRVWLMVAAVAVMLMVRPHMAGMIVMALAGSYIVKPRVPMSRRLLLGGAALLASALIVPYALGYAGVGDDADVADLAAYIQQRQQIGDTGTTSVDLASMSPLAQLFTYLFRPLPLEAGSLFGLVSSLDNVVLLLLCVVGIWNIIRRRRPATGGNRTFMWMYVFLAWSILAVTTPNLGISLRQKWMFAPILIFLLISVIGKARTVTPRRRMQQLAPPPVRIASAGSALSTRRSGTTSGTRF